MIYFSILAERMKQIYGENLEYFLAEDLPVSHSQFYERNEEAETGILLIGTPENLPSEKLVYCFLTVITNRTAPSKKKELPKNLNQILVRGSTQTSVYNQTNRIIQDFESWELNMAESVARGRTLSALLELASVQLANPIALLDSSITLIHYAGAFHGKERDSLWDTVFATGSSMEFFSFEDWKQIGELMKQTENPFLYNRLKQPADSALPFTDNEIVCCPLKYKGRMLGGLGSTSINKPFTIGELKIIRRVKEFLEQAFVIQSTFQKTNLHSYYNLTKYLNGEAVDTALILRYLKIRSWHEQDTYQILCFQRPDKERSCDEFALPYMTRLRNIFPTALLVPVDVYILAILNLSMGSEITEKDEALLTAFYERFQMPAGITMPFKSFLNIKQYYPQGILALEIGQEKYPHSPFYHYKSLFLEHVIRSLKTQNKGRTFCIPDIACAVDEGLLTQENLKLLTVYLAEGCNIQNTANTLSMHRNTLTYRLNKLKDLLDMDFENMELDTKFHLLISCLICRKA